MAGPVIEGKVGLIDGNPSGQCVTGRIHVCAKMTVALQHGDIEFFGAVDLCYRCHVKWLTARINWRLLYGAGDVNESHG